MYMFPISWCLTHWKLAVAVFLVIAFSFRRTKTAPQRETSSKMKRPIAEADDGPAPASASPAPNAPDASPSPAETSEEVSAQGETLNPIFEEITGFFASGNPKHALEGLTDGLCNAATGVGLGLAGVVAGTYGGAKEGGLGGMAKGFGAGVAGLVGLTAYGAYAGVRQIVRGVSNTPSAVSEVNRGEAYWDSNAQAWVRVNLVCDFDALPQTDEDLLGEARRAYEKAKKDSTHSSPPPTTRPTGLAADGEAPETSSAGDLEGDSSREGAGEESAGSVAPEPINYYALLDVEPTATAGEIRKAYTRKALAMHPDKNPNDPDATIKFQELNRVYSVLSHEDTRATYDRHGTIDPAHVPGMAVNPMKELLGASFLDALVGTLHFFLVFEEGLLFTAEMKRELHARRRLRVAKNLVSWLDDGESGFQSAQVVLRDAVSTVLGPVFLSYVAEQYHLSSRQQLHGSTWTREMDSWYSSWAMSASSLWHWTSMGARTARRAIVDRSLGEEDVLRVLAVANENDIRCIVQQACRLVLYDTSVTAERRRQRALCLEELSVMVMEEVAREVASRQHMHTITASEAATSGTSKGTAT